MVSNYDSRKVYSKPFLLLLYLIVTILFVLLMISIRNADFGMWSKYFSLLILVQFTFQYFLLKILNIKMFSLTGMFLVLSYLFHFGQLLIIVYFPNYDIKGFNFYEFYDSYGLKVASEIALISIQMVGLGILLSKNKEKDFLRIGDKKSLSHCIKIGWIIVFFTFPIQLYIDMAKLLISINAGYLATYEFGIAGIWGAIGYVSFTGFTLLILGYSENKKKSLAIFVCLIFYLLLTMLSGHRGHQITIILFLIFIVHKSVYRIKGKRVVLFLVCSFIGIALLNTLAVFRNIEGRNIIMFWELLLENLKGDSIKEIIVELGGTINTIYMVIQQVPNNIPHAFGATYPASSFSAIPNLGNIFGEINKYAHYTNSIRGHALGGSYIGELFYNFSYIGILFAVFVGIFVNKISQKIEILLKYKHYYKLSYFAPLFMYILWWPRDTFSSMVRPFIWGAIILFILSRMLGKRKEKRS